MYFFVQKRRCTIVCCNAPSKKKIKYVNLVAPVRPNVQKMPMVTLDLTRGVWKNVQKGTKVNDN